MNHVKRVIAVLCLLFLQAQSVCYAMFRRAVAAAPQKGKVEMDCDVRVKARTALAWLDDVRYEKFKAFQGKESWKYLQNALDDLEREIRGACEVFGRQDCRGERQSDVRKTKFYHHGCYFAVVFSLVRFVLFIEEVSCLLTGKDGISEDAFTRGRARLADVDKVVNVGDILKDIQQSGLSYITEEWGSVDWRPLREAIVGVWTVLTRQLRDILMREDLLQQSAAVELFEKALTNLSFYIELNFMADAYCELNARELPFRMIHRTASFNKCPVMRAQFRPFIEGYKRGERPVEHDQRVLDLISKMVADGDQFLSYWAEPYHVESASSEELLAQFSDLELDHELDHDALLAQIKAKEQRRVERAVEALSVAGAAVAPRVVGAVGVNTAEKTVR